MVLFLLMSRILCMSPMAEKTRFYVEHQYVFHLREITANFFYYTYLKNLWICSEPVLSLFWTCWEWSVSIVTGLIVIGKCNQSVDVRCQKLSLSLLLACLFLFWFREALKKMAPARKKTNGGKSCPGPPNFDSTSDPELQNLSQVLWV